MDETLAVLASVPTRQRPPRLKVSAGWSSRRVYVAGFPRVKVLGAPR